MRTKDKLMQKARRNITATGADPAKKLRAKRMASLRLPYAGLFRLVDGATGGVAASKALKMVFAERRRQVEEEGLSFEHDETVNYGGELAFAARCYLAYRAEGETRCTPHFWPWSGDWWKPGYRRPGGRSRDLVKAGALLLAEADRVAGYGIDTLAMAAGEVARLARKGTAAGTGETAATAVRELDAYLSMRPTLKGAVRVTAMAVLALAYTIKEKK